MEMTVGFPELGSRFAPIGGDDKLEDALYGMSIKIVTTLRVKVTVSNLDAILAPHELVLIHQEDFDPESTFTEVQTRAKDFAEAAISRLKAPD